MVKELVSGIDEAGRGSVFGPLIIVGLSIYTKELNKLQKLGVKDSKLFKSPTGRTRRSELASVILNTAKQCNTIKVSAIEIDQALARRPKDNLNLLEIRNFYSLIKDLNGSTIHLDNVSSPKYTMNQLKKLIQNNSNKISVKVKSVKNDECTITLEENSFPSKKIIISKKADSKYTVVSAASCVAKHIRDQNLREIEREWKLPELSLGQGYPNSNDKQVMNFLKKHKNLIRNQTFPFIRYKWEWQVLQEILTYPEKELDYYL
jgi:ribonuclease HII